ncbi:ATP-binding protein [Rhodococcus coprophilus]|uniref:ATP-binding protein n=1 Tax=Rhodococcus coprophilus TaxID=38310 RepID=UPI0037B8427B
MTIRVEEIPGEAVRLLLRLEEGHFHDLKAIDIAPASLTKTMAAFANADGGEIYIGIDEVTDSDGKKYRQWRGFASQEDANGHIQIFETLFPLGGEHRYGFLESESATGKVLHVEIDKSISIKSASNGKIYKRRGASNLPVTTDEDKRNLERTKGISSFETETVPYPVSNIVESAITAKFMEHQVPTNTPEAWFKKQRLISHGELATVASILLFDDEPQIALPKRSGIKVYRYRTSDAEGSRKNLAWDPVTIEGSIYNQIYAAVEKVVDVVGDAKITDVDGLRGVQYPSEAIHEIVTNAVIHRDYSILDDIHIRIFDNRVEVESPGRLPAHITPANILEERYSRNPTIVRLINKFPDAPNKDVGEGLNTAFDAMKSLKLKEPIISERPNSVLVVIRHERLGSPEEICMEYLKDHDEINNRTLRTLTGIGSENAIKRVFNRLIESRQIERIPGRSGPASAYRTWTGDLNP